MSGVPNLKYKTSLCNAWKEGKLKIMQVFSAKKPNFVSLRMARQSFGPWNKEFLSQHSPQLLLPASYKFKTSYCKFYSKGDCKLGENCSFAHNKAEKRQKSYIPKQQAYIDPSLYQFSPYYPGYASQYPGQVPEMYQFYPYYPQPQTQTPSPQSHKSQQRQQKMDENQPKTQQPQTDCLQKGSHSL